MKKTIFFVGLRQLMISEFRIAAFLIYTYGLSLVVCGSTYICDFLIKFHLSPSSCIIKFCRITFSGAGTGLCCRFRGSYLGFRVLRIRVRVQG